jgi:hypothetical protein
VRWRDPSGLDNGYTVYYYSYVQLYGHPPPQPSTAWADKAFPIVVYGTGVAALYYTSPLWVPPAVLVAAPAFLSSDLNRELIVNGGEYAEKTFAAAEALFRPITPEDTSAQPDIEPPELAPAAVPSVPDPNAPPGPNPSGPPAPQYAGAAGLPGFNSFFPGPIGIGGGSHSFTDQ